MRTFSIVHQQDCMSNAVLIQNKQFQHFSRLIFKKQVNEWALVLVGI